MKYKPFRNNIYKVNLTKLKLYSNLSYKSKTSRNKNVTVNHSTFNKNQNSINTSSSFTTRGNSTFAFRKVTSNEPYRFKMPIIPSNNNKNIINKTFLILNNLFNSKNKKITLSKAQPLKKIYLKKENENNESIVILKNNVTKEKVEQKSNRATTTKEKEEIYSNKQTINVETTLTNSNKGNVGTSQTKLANDDEGELSLDEVRDIIKTFSFEDKPYLNCIFYKNDYDNYCNKKKEKYVSFFFQK